MPPPTPELILTLRRLPLFTDLSDQELALIAENVRRLHYKEGATIFSEGDLCHELLIVEEGTVKIIKSAPDGRQQLIGLERRGNSLAEVPVFDGGRYPATAEAASATVLLRLPADEFRKICLQNPELALKVFKVLGHRLRQLMSDRGSIVLYRPWAADLAPPATGRRDRARDSARNSIRT